MNKPLQISLAFLAAIALATSAAAHDKDDDLEIVTLSNRADLVSGGDALVEVRVPKKTTLSKVKVKLNGHDITSAFTANASARTLRGLVTGLAVGRNELSADDGKGHEKEVRLIVTNHPQGGPVLSGPQITPYFCATPTPQPATPTSPATNASGLSQPAVGPECNIPAERKLYYRTTATGCSLSLPDANSPPANPCFKAYNPALPRPTDMATIPHPTSGVAGQTIDYIVQVERGTMNRGIYDIAVLFDPTKPWANGTAPQAQWTSKVYYQFGAATGQPRRQARTTSSWINEMVLTRGYLVAQNSMTDSSLNSNRVSMAETVMMMKEHIGDRYGQIKFTMGAGCSGGSINSNMNASIMPTQLDGITISCAYPDSETTGMEVGDCVLLAEAYVKLGWSDNGPAQAANNLKKAAINGHLDQNGCHSWYNSFGSNGKVGNYFARSVTNSAGAIGQSTTLSNNCQLLTSQVYDPLNNPNGARCHAWNWAASILGTVPNELSPDPSDRRARDTRDNTGVQYGLKALLSGAISAEEFVTLNELVGAYDKDSNFQPARAVPDRGVLEVVYRSGIVMSGRQYAKTAVIDLRGWDDQGIHHQYRTFSIRERLDREYGDHDNQVIWRFSNGLTPTGSSAFLNLDAFNTMDQWLTNLKADASRRRIEDKVRSAKPAGVADFCLVGTTKVADMSTCATLEPRFKVYASPRQVAGSGLSENILKCQLKPLNSADYSPVVLSSAQLARLNAVFSDGVCDWSKRGVDQVRADSPRDYTDGPGGERLPSAPDDDDHGGHGHGHGHDDDHDHGHGHGHHHGHD